MVFFNDPIEQQDHVERASVWRWPSATTSRGLRKGGASSDIGWGFGVGIATGYATLGRIGFEGRGDYAAVGSVVNLGARLCGHAEDGQILLSPRTTARLESKATVSDAGEMTIKGFSQPVRVSELISIDGLDH